MTDPATSVRLPPPLERLARVLSARTRRQLPDDGLVAAAVLVPLVLDDHGESQLLFTKRTDLVATHKGQVSFPGGIREPDDGSPWDTAIREMTEELGLPADRPARLGMLDDYVTITDFHVTPCVGWLRDLNGIQPAPNEIEEWFLVPLSFLLEPGTHEVRVVNYQEGQREVHFYHTRPHIVWGATAAMASNLLGIMEQL